MEPEILHQLIVSVCFVTAVFVVAVMLASTCIEVFHEARSIRKKTSTARDFHGILPEKKMIGSGGKKNYGSKPHFISGR